MGVLDFQFYCLFRMSGVARRFDDLAVTGVAVWHACSAFAWVIEHPENQTFVLLDTCLLSFFSALRFLHRKTCLPKVKQDIILSAVKVRGICPAFSDQGK